MRLPNIALLTLLTLPLPACATPLIDDLRIVGDGHTITFSLPSILPPGNFFGSDEYTTFTDSTAAIDDIGGYDLTVGFHAILDGSRRPTSGGMDISLPGSFDYNLGGVPSIIDGNGPGFFSAYLVAGNYTLSEIPPNNTADSFFVSVTPETGPSPVPEPGTLGLLLTGLLTLLLARLQKLAHKAYMQMRLHLRARHSPLGTFARPSCEARLAESVLAATIQFLRPNSHTGDWHHERSRP